MDILKSFLTLTCKSYGCKSHHDILSFLILVMVIISMILMTMIPSQRQQKEHLITMREL